MRRSKLSIAIAAAMTALTTSAAHGGPQEDLASCGAISDPTERLACYDRVAGRTPAPPAAAQPSVSGAAPGAPAGPAAPQVAPTPAPPAAAPAAPAVAAKPAAATQPAVPAAQAQGADAAAAFGSYSVEHPVTQVAQTLSVQITAMGKTIDGRPTVTLEGGALWLLDEVDPLLAVGDTVIISRGLLGSFLLETPSRRLHHVRRIR